MNARETKIAEHLRSHMTEFLDGFVVVGFIAGSESPVVIVDAKDARTAFALNYAKDHIHLVPTCEPESE